MCIDLPADCPVHMTEVANHLGPCQVGWKGKGRDNQQLGKEGSDRLRNWIPVEFFHSLGRRFTGSVNPTHRGLDHSLSHSRLIQDPCLVLHMENHPGPPPTLYQDKCFHLLHWGLEELCLLKWVEHWRPKMGE